MFIKCVEKLPSWITGSLTYGVLAPVLLTYHSLGAGDMYARAPAETKRRKRMRKWTILSGMVALMIALCASVALASAHQCSGRPCTGTGSANTLYERPGNGVPDAIYGRAATSSAPIPIPAIPTASTATEAKT